MNTREITNNLIDKIVGMYVPDGNPEIWLDKIMALKMDSEFQLGEELKFNVFGNSLQGKFKSIEDGCITIETTYDSIGVTNKGEDTIVHITHLIK